VKPNFNAAFEYPRGPILILDPSKRCEPSAFLFSQAVRFFDTNGYEFTDHVNLSRIILVNTCCVTQDKINLSISALDFAKARGEGKQIVLFGCLAGLDVPGVEHEGLICIGPKNLGELDEYFPHHTSVNNIFIDKPYLSLYEPGQGLSYSDHFLLIAQGCSNKCSYCNIKRVKGEVRSVPSGNILNRLRSGLSGGAGEFVLLADDCASYGDDLGTDLIDLISMLFAEGTDFSLKLGYVYPQFLLKKFEGIREIFASGRIRYVNFPMQSGSSRILKLMNRLYNVDSIRQALAQLRKVAPQTTFCTHLMLNFPSESRDDFLASLALADDFDEVLFLNYSDNMDTPAARIFPKVSETEVRRRLDLASDYANRHKPGRSAVIQDFNCIAPYNIRRQGG